MCTRLRLLAAASAAAVAAEPQGRRGASLQDCTAFGVTLHGCSTTACPSVNAAALAIGTGGTAAQSDIDVMCAEYDNCVEALFKQDFVKAAAGGLTAEQLCSTAAAKCNIMGLVPLPECRSEVGCASTTTAGLGLLAGNAPAEADLQKVCFSPLREKCWDVAFENPIVAGAANGVTAESSCANVVSPPCSIFGVVTLPNCPLYPCEAVTRYATAVTGGQVPLPYDINVMCSLWDDCADALIANPLAQSALPGITTEGLCGPKPVEGPPLTMPPSCPTPGQENTNRSERCSVTQKTSGLNCCDDRHGELPAVNETCVSIANDVTEDCKKDVNERLREMWRCPIDDANGTRRLVRDVCPRRCKNQVVPGCECPSSYDKGCPSRSCLVPDTEKYDWDPECDDCEVYGATLKCTEPDQVVRQVLTYALPICLGVLGIGVFAYTLHHRTKSPDNVPTRQRRQSSLIKMFGRKAPGAAALARLLDKAHNMFERYRQFFDRLCYRFGYFLAGHRGIFFVEIVGVLLIIAVCGLPLAEKDDSPSSSDWAPEGGRLAHEIEYYDKWNSPTANYPTLYVMVSDDNGGTAMTQRHVRAMHQVLEELRGVTVEAPRADGNGTLVISYEDFCLRIPENPTFDVIYPGEKPCVNPGVLDCFFEGAWQIENVSSGWWPDPVSEATVTLEKAVAQLNAIFGTRSAVVDTYRDRHSYTTRTDEEIRQTLSFWNTNASKTGHGGCQHWANTYSIPRADALGGMVTDPRLQCPLTESHVDSEVVSSKALAHILFLMSIDTAQDGRRRLRDILASDLLTARRELRQKITDTLEAANGNEEKYPGIQVTVVYSEFYDDVVDELSSAQLTSIIVGYCLMSVVIVWELHCKEPINNLFPIAVLYFVFIMVIATAAAYGIIALAGMKYNHLMMQVLPYLSIGLGVDDMFLLLHYFRAVPDKTRPSREITAELMQGGGQSVTLTSLTNLITFFGGASVKIPALRNYLLLGGIIVLLNYVSSVICLPLMLSWWTDHHREKGNIPPPCKDETEAEKSAGVAEKFVCEKLVPIMRKKPVQVSIVVVWAAALIFFTVSLTEIAPMTVDFKITDLAPRGTYLSESVHVYQDEFFGQKYRHEWLVELGDGSGVGEVGQGLDLSEPRVQQLMQNVTYVLGELATGVWKNHSHWLYRFYEFVEEQNASHVHKKSWDTGEAALTLCDNACLLPNNETYCRATNQCGVYRAGYPWYVDKDLFWKYFHQWRHPIDGGIHSLTATAYGVTSWGYAKGPNNYDSGCGRGHVGECNVTANVLQLGKTTFEQLSGCLNSPGDWERHVGVMRGIISGGGLGSKAYPRPTDAFFDVELFETTLDFFWTTLAVSVCGILVAGIVVPVSIRGALIISLSGLAATIELLGMLMLADVSFTTTIAVSVIMSIGLSVDPVVHAVAAYEHSHDYKRPERLRHAMQYSTVPVLKSGFSTIISFIMMAASPFPYVFKYSFLPLLLSICISIVHGTVAVPALLGLVGTELDDPEEEHEMTGVSAGTGSLQQPAIPTLITAVQPLDLGGSPKKESDEKDVTSKDDDERAADRTTQHQAVQEQIAKKRAGSSS